MLHPIFSTILDGFKAQPATTGYYSPAARLARREATRYLADATATAKARVLAERTALPSHDLDTPDLRRWAIAACTAELKHAELDTLGLVARHTLGAVIDNCSDPDWHAEFRLPHEHAAGLVLNWASHLRTQEGFITGPWSRWHLNDRAGRLELLATRRRLKRGFLAAVANYRAARRAIDSKGNP
jgi:hypothetical protein